MFHTDPCPFVMAVLINKVMIEIPPKFAGRPPVSLAAKERKEHKDLDSDSMRSFAFFCVLLRSFAFFCVLLRPVTEV